MSDESIRTLRRLDLMGALAAADRYETAKARAGEPVVSEARRGLVCDLVKALKRRRDSTLLFALACCKTADQRAFVRGERRWEKKSFRDRIPQDPS